MPFADSPSAWAAAGGSGRSQPAWPVLLCEEAERSRSAPLPPSSSSLQESGPWRWGARGAGLVGGWGECAAQAAPVTLFSTF